LHNPQLAKTIRRSSMLYKTCESKRTFRLNGSRWVQRMRGVLTPSSRITNFRTHLMVHRPCSLKVLSLFSFPSFGINKVRWRLRYRCECLYSWPYLYFSRRYSKESDLQMTFSKRRSSLFKKASEFCTFRGVDVALVILTWWEGIFLW
jgi:hypothetical protein